MIRNELEQEMSKKILNQKTLIKKKLSIDENTSFNILYDIYSIDKTDYLYIKLIENSAVAPFYYNISYKIEELRAIHNIFKAVDMDEVKSALNDLFDNNKVKLYYEKNKEIVIMELDAKLFVKNHLIKFELKKQMIPENEKDDKLIELYKIIKNKNDLAKELYALLKNIKGGIDNKIIDNFKDNFDLNEVDEEEEISEYLKKYIKKKENGFIGEIFENLEGCFAELILRNRSNVIWKKGFMKLKLDENASDIICKEIIYPIYDIEKKEEGGILFSFYGDIKPGEYKMSFDVFINAKKLNDIKLILNLIKK